MYKIRNLESGAEFGSLECVEEYTNSNGLSLEAKYSRWELIEIEEQ